MAAKFRNSEEIFRMGIFFACVSKTKLILRLLGDFFPLVGNNSKSLHSILWKCNLEIVFEDFMSIGSNHPQSSHLCSLSINCILSQHFIGQRADCDEFVPPSLSSLGCLSSCGVNNNNILLRHISPNGQLNLT